jgi:HlyD family secretion protein
MKLTTALLITIVLAGCSNNGGKTITETGTLEAKHVTISAQVSGVLQFFGPEEGTMVAKGDTIARVDPMEWQYQLAQAEANMRAADAQYRLALEGPRKEDVAQGKANYESAKTDLQRMEELFKAKSISDKNVEDARTRFTLAEQMWEKLQRGSRREEVDLAKARRDQATAQMAQLQKKVNDCTITAPIGGTIVNRFIEPGELVTPGAAVARIADLREMEVNIYVAETVLPRIQLNQRATVVVDAFPERQFEARVVFLSPTAEFTPKNIQTKDERIKLVFAVKLKVQNAEGSLKAGLPADVTLDFGGEEK